MASGNRGGLDPYVVDATAGLGGDAFVLACLGCRVRMFERHPVVAALLDDGLRRAYTDPIKYALFPLRNALVLSRRSRPIVPRLIPGR